MKIMFSYKVLNYMDISSTWKHIILSYSSILRLHVRPRLGEIPPVPPKLLLCGPVVGARFASMPTVKERDQKITHELCVYISNHHKTIMNETQHN